MNLRVGIIGLGVMGKPMAQRLLAAGYPVTVWNRTASKQAPLVELGAKSATAPAEVARASDVVITMVGDGPDVKAVLEGPQGVLSEARPGLVVVDMSTIAPAVAREIEALCAPLGVAFLDAPVSGGERGAIEGALSIMVGGPEPDFRRLKPLFEALGKTITHCGPVGAGQSFKLVNQVVCGLNILAWAEGLALAEQLGLDLEQALSVLSKGSAASWMLSNLAPRAIAGDFEPGFRVKLKQKDLRIALSAAASVHQPVPGTALVNQLFASLEAAGESEQGTQALLKVMRKLGPAGREEQTG